MVSILGAKRSAWNTADIRGKTEVLLAQTCLLADPAARAELAEDITARAADRCIKLLNRTAVREHIRSLTSRQVLQVEADIVARIARRSAEPTRKVRIGGRGLAAVVGALAGDGPFVVVEGAAGAEKTTALRSTQELLSQRGHRLMVVTPTLKAAEVAAAETGADGHSAAWLIHQHGWRWDADGHWTRQPNPAPDAAAQLRGGDLLLVDEAGMLDQDTGRALLNIADETGARVAFVGDRHQLPAVGRGGVLEHAVAWAHPTAVVTLEKVHRFTDPDYAALSLRMRNGDDAGSVFDALHHRGQVVIHASEVERSAVLAAPAPRVIWSSPTPPNKLPTSTAPSATTTAAARTLVGRSPLLAAIGSGSGTGWDPSQRSRSAGGEPPDLDRHRDQGGLQLLLNGRGRDREIPADYATQFVELAYATTVHGAQGSTVRSAHVAIGQHTGAASAYVAMTRGRHANVAHLVADTVEDARRQWIEVFSRDCADLGPSHVRRQAIDAIDRYGLQPRHQRRPGAPLSWARDDSLSI